VTGPPAQGDAPGPRGARRLLAWGALALAVLAATVVAYLPSVDGGFYFDEWNAILSNHAIREVGRVLAAMSPAALLGPGRPVADFAFSLDFALGGLEPRGYHLTSLALHLAAVALVFLLARGALRAAGHARAGALAAFVAAAFSLHPLQAESVAYPAQRSEVLSAVLYLAGLLALLRADREWPRRSAWAWALGAAGLHALALGAKAVAVTLPAAFVLHRAVLGGGAPGAPPLRTRLVRALAVSAPAWALTILAVARNLSSLGPTATAGTMAGELGPVRYLLSEVRVLWLYARLALWPAGLNVDHDLAASPGLGDAATVTAGLAVAAALAGVALLWSRAGRGQGGANARAAAFGVGWWFLLLSPTSTIVPIVDLVAEHRAYLALAGLLLAAAAAADAAAARWLPAARARALPAAGAMACLALAVALHVRAGDWSSPLALWEDAARKSPLKARALTNYAWALQGAGRTREAIAYYGRAAANAPSLREQAEVARNLSMLYLDGLGDPAGALAVLDPVVARLPGHVELRRNRAYALLALGRLDEAWRDASVARSRDPWAPELHDLAGLVLVAQGRLEEAEGAFRRAAEIDPADPAFLEHHFLALARLGRAREACSTWRALARTGATPGEPARARAAALGCLP
jgi:tetratricopeptide (TPR) repeat protein